MNIYIGNLPHEVTEDQLREIFVEYGEVTTARIITDKFSGKSRGFGFVEMDEESAKKAIAELDQAELGERTITVNEAKPKENNRGGGGRGGSRGGRPGGGGRGGSRGGRPGGGGGRGGDSRGNSSGGSGGGGRGRY